MLNSSTNFKEDTFGKDNGNSINNTFLNSNPYYGGILDGSFPEKVI